MSENNLKTDDVVEEIVEEITLKLDENIKDNNTEELIEVVDNTKLIIDENDDEKDDDKDNEPVKRPVGRPRKPRPVKKSKPVGRPRTRSIIPNEFKRPVGRPKVVKPMRKPGRPKKNPNKEVIKKPVGRPRKPRPVKKHNISGDVINVVGRPRKYVMINGLYHCDCCDINVRNISQHNRTTKHLHNLEVSQNK